MKSRACEAQSSPLKARATHRHAATGDILILSPAAQHNTQEASSLHDDVDMQWWRLFRLSVDSDASHAPPKQMPSGRSDPCLQGATGRRFRPGWFGWFGCSRWSRWSLQRISEGQTSASLLLRAASLPRNFEASGEVWRPKILEAPRCMRTLLLGLGIRAPHKTIKLDPVGPFQWAVFGPLCKARWFRLWQFLRGDLEAPDVRTGGCSARLNSGIFMFMTP